jgi:hypothetical protein
MVAGQRYAAQVALRNVGDVVWKRSEKFRLGSEAPRNTDRWGILRVRAPGPIAPGETAVFSFDVVAPGVPGVYPFQWQMVQDGVRWFGEPTALLPITVVTPDAPPARH